MRDFTPRIELPARTHMVIDSWVAAIPDACAVEEIGGSLSYAEQAVAVDLEQLHDLYFAREACTNS